MVYEPGGYNFLDYIKLGLPLQIVCGIFTVAIVFSLEQWWAYALVFAFLSPAIVAAFFFLDRSRVAPEAPRDDGKLEGLQQQPANDVGTAEELEAGRLGYRGQPAATQELHAVAPPTLPQS
jgi:hypothetical protein